MRRIGIALAGIAVATLLASAAAYAEYYAVPLGLAGVALLFVVLFVSPLALGGMFGLVLTRHRHWRLVDLLVAFPGSAAVALLATLPLFWEEWDYFRRTPAPAIGWELAPLGVVFLSVVPPVLGALGYLAGVAIGAWARGATRQSVTGISGAKWSERWGASTFVACATITALVAAVVLPLRVFGPLTPPPPPLPPEPPVACASPVPATDERVFHGDPRSVAPLPTDLGPDWNPYTSDTEEVALGAYSATYRLGNPQGAGLLFTFKVRIFGDVGGAADEYCQHEEHPRSARDFLIGDGMFVRPNPSGNGMIGVGRARNVLIEMGTWSSASSEALPIPYTEAAMRAFTQRVDDLAQEQ